MKIKFIGAGSAFNFKDYNSNMVIEKNGKKLLIDCGMTAPLALAEAYDIHGGNVGQEIDAVYISHLHADHIGAMEWLGFCTYFNPSSLKPKLYSVRSVMEDMWENSLKGGMESLQGQISDLTTFFDCVPLEENEWFKWEGISFMPVQTIHIVSGYKFMNSYGLMICRNDGGEWCAQHDFFLTTDTQCTPNQLKDFYGQTGIIFHDCETSPFKSGVHAHYTELLELDEEIRNKMWLYHYQPGELPDAKADGFAGFIKKGQEFEF